MVAYTFARDRLPAITEGRQVAALFAPRPHPATAPHADVGDTIRIIAPRTRAEPRSRIAEHACALRATVIMTRDALLRVIDRQIDDACERAEQFDRLLNLAEQGAAADVAAMRERLAALLGFDSWADAYAYNAASGRRGRPDADGRITRELVVWSDQ